MLKPRLSQEQIEKLEERIKLKELVEGNELEKLFQLLEEREKEKTRNLEYIRYLSNAKVENRIQNIIISLDKVKYYLNNVKDPSPPLSYLSPDDKFANLWGRLNKFHRRKRTDNQILPIVEELIDLMKYYAHYEECQYVLKFITFLDPFISKYHEESVEKALLAWRLCCLNIHYVFNSIKEPLFHSGALLITLYFYAFTHTYFTPHE